METLRPKVTVLLAVLNGRRFLEEQMTSLLAQEGVDLTIHANDDGSVDGSYELLQTWKENGSISKLTKSNRIGFSQAFFSLLNAVDSPDWVAFCDQDDIWSRDKLYSQVNHLVSSGGLMSFCPRIYINSQGSVIGRSRSLRIEPSFRNALVENISPGNTILLHPTAVNLVKKYHSKVEYYDAWIYLLISGIGHCVYLPVPLVSYRLHDDNSIGTRKFRIGSILNVADKYFTNARDLEQYALEALSYQNQAALIDFNRALNSNSIFSFIYRLRKSKFRRQHRFDQVVIILSMVLNYAKYRLTSIFKRR
jgi:glycosyltransferase involved in cell wall biosynthesis